MSGLLTILSFEGLEMLRVATLWPGECSTVLQMILGSSPFEAELLEAYVRVHPLQAPRRGAETGIDPSEVENVLARDALLNVCFLASCAHNGRPTRRVVAVASMLAAYGATPLQSG